MSTEEIPSFDYQLLSKQFGAGLVENVAICVTEHARSAQGLPVNIHPTADLVGALLKLMSKRSYSAFAAGWRGGEDWKKSAKEAPVHMQQKFDEWSSPS